MAGPVKADLSQDAVLAYLRREPTGPATFEQLWEATRVTSEYLAEVLADLCCSGPLVAIDVGGDCLYALEWGVKHPSES